MNNSFNIGLDEEFLKETDKSEQLWEREAKLMKMIEALVALSESREWSTLKEELFGDALESIERRINAEAQKPEVNIPELYRLQGERKWAKRYADPLSLVDTMRVELANIRKQLNPPTAGE